MPHLKRSSSDTSAVTEAPPYECPIRQAFLIASLPAKKLLASKLLLRLRPCRAFPWCMAASRLYAVTSSLILYLQESMRGIYR